VNLRKNFVEGHLIRLVEFRIKNYKSIRDLKLETLSNFNVLVGKNNTGKSTILDALQTFTDVLHRGSSLPQDDHVWPLGKPSNAPIEFTAVIELTMDELKDAKVAHYDRINDLIEKGIVLVTVSYEISKDRASPLQTSTSSALNRAGPSISKKDVELFLLGYIRGNLGNSKRIDVIRGQIPAPPDFRMGLRGTLIPKATIDNMREWVNSRQAEPTRKFEEVVNIFRRLTNEEWGLTFAGEHLCLTNGDYNAEVNALGGGIQEMIHLAYELVNAPLLLMIEEPESHAHPEQAKRVYNVLRSLSTNHIIFITTHSTLFAELAKFSEVYQIYKTNGVTECRKIGDSEFASVASDLGISPADIFMTSSIVFVEGECDQIVLEGWARMLGYSLEPPTAGIIRMDGMGKAKHQSAVWKGVVERILLPMVWIFDSSVKDRIIDDLIRKGVKKEAVIRLEGDIEDYYPRGPLLNHLSQAWNLNEQQSASLKSSLQSDESSKAITRFLQKEGDPQPEATEWKIPAARYIANRTATDEYTETEKKRISNLIDQIMKAIQE
jgi:putative ATP-dependent endonuclease of OLD family